MGDFFYIRCNGILYKYPIVENCKLAPFMPQQVSNESVLDLTDAEVFCVNSKDGVPIITTKFLSWLIKNQVVRLWFNFKVILTLTSHPSDKIRLLLMCTEFHHLVIDAFMINYFIDVVSIKYLFLNHNNLTIRCFSVDQWLEWIEYQKIRDSGHHNITLSIDHMLMTDVITFIFNWKGDPIFSIGNYKSTNSTITIGGESYGISERLKEVLNLIGTYYSKGTNKRQRNYPDFEREMIEAGFECYLPD